MVDRPEPFQQLGDLSEEVIDDLQVALVRSGAQLVQRPVQPLRLGTTADVSEERGPPLLTPRRHQISATHDVEHSEHGSAPDG